MPKYNIIIVTAFQILNFTVELFFSVQNILRKFQDLGLHISEE